MALRKCIFWVASWSCLVCVCQLLIAMSPFCPIYVNVPVFMPVACIVSGLWRALLECVFSGLCFAVLVFQVRFFLFLARGLLFLLRRSPWSVGLFLSALCSSCCGGFVRWSFCVMLIIVLVCHPIWLPLSPFERFGRRSFPFWAYTLRWRFWPLWVVSLNKRTCPWLYVDLGD